MELADFCSKRREPGMKRKGKREEVVGGKSGEFFFQRLTTFDLTSHSSTSRNAVETSRKVSQQNDSATAANRKK